MNNHTIHFRFVDPFAERDIISQALGLLAIEFMAIPEKRVSWIERMASVMQNDFNSVEQGMAERGGAMCIGFDDDTIVSVFTLKFYGNRLLQNQHYFVFNKSKDRIAVSTFGNIATKLCGPNDGKVISEYDLSFVKDSHRGQNLHQRASELAYRYVTEKHGGHGVSFVLIRSRVSGIGTSLGRELQQHITGKVGLISLPSFLSNDFTPTNSISVPEANEIIRDEPVFTVHPSSGAAAHMALKLGGTIVAHLAANFSTLFLMCHRK